MVDAGTVSRASQNPTSHCSHGVQWRCVLEGAVDSQRWSLRGSWMRYPGGRVTKDTRSRRHMCQWVICLRIREQTGFLLLFLSFFFFNYILFTYLLGVSGHMCASEGQRNLQESVLSSYHVSHRTEFLLSALASIPYPKVFLLGPRSRQGSLGCLSTYYDSQSDLELLVLLSLPSE